MKLSQFKFHLPTELIALYPEENRENARLMVLHRKTGEIEHKTFKDIIDYFDDGDVMVLNNTQVFPARLYGNKEKTGAKIEVFLLRELDKESRLWDVLVDPARKIRIGNKLYFGDNDLLVAEVIDNTTSRGRTLRFLYDGSYEEFRETLFSIGTAPIPKYIKREVEPEDNIRYQTIFAKKEGAVAPPNAGLSFSRELLKRLEIKGINFAELTLHIGLGSARPIEVEDLTKYKMDSEEFFIPEDCVEIVNQAKDKNKKICAVGSSVVRAMESVATTTGKIKVFEGWTNKFIFPYYEFSVPNCLLTTFHQPQSPVFMLNAAFAGSELLAKAYKQAVQEKYRFLAYGDNLLIL